MSERLHIASSVEEKALTTTPEKSPAGNRLGRRAAIGLAALSALGLSLSAYSNGQAIQTLEVITIEHETDIQDRLEIDKRIEKSSEPIGEGLVEKVSEEESVEELAEEGPEDSIENPIILTTNPEIIQYEPALPAPKGGEVIDPSSIVLHWWAYESGSDPSALARGLIRQGFSVQFGVTKDGKIYQMMESPDLLAYHAGPVNDQTIGIEIEGGAEGDQYMFDPEKPEFNEEMYAAVTSLTAKLVKDYDINMDIETGKVNCSHVDGIRGHLELNHCYAENPKKSDPSFAFTEAVIDGVEFILENE